MRRKLKSRRGVSMVEMLVALLVLSLLTAGGVTATSAVMADYGRMQDAANADILASTVIETISNEIRLGKDITVETDAEGKTSALHLGVSAFSDKPVTLRLDGNKLVAVTTDAAAGTEVTKQLLSEDAYSGLSLKDLTFELEDPDPSDPTVTAGRAAYSMNFTVYGDRSESLWTGGASAAPLAEQ